MLAATHRCRATVVYCLLFRWRDILGSRGVRRLFDLLIRFAQHFVDLAGPALLLDFCLLGLLIVDDPVVIPAVAHDILPSVGHTNNRRNAAERAIVPTMARNQRQFAAFGFYSSPWNSGR